MGTGLNLAFFVTVSAPLESRHCLPLCRSTPVPALAGVWLMMADHPGPLLCTLTFTTDPLGFRSTQQLSWLTPPFLSLTPFDKWLFLKWIIVGAAQFCIDNRSVKYRVGVFTPESQEMFFFAPLR